MDEQKKPEPVVTSKENEVAQQDELHGHNPVTALRQRMAQLKKASHTDKSTFIQNDDKWRGFS